MINDSQSSELQIETLQLKKAALVFRAVNHKLRQQILGLIHQKGNITVTAIYIHFRLEQSVVSQHLAILRKAGFVVTNRNGKFIYYAVNHDRLTEAHSYADQMIKAKGKTLKAQ
jgi:DNA-binding transcriptional ArsR family regulator